MPTCNSFLKKFHHIGEMKHFGKFAGGNHLHILQALADQCKFRHDCSDCRRVERFRVKNLLLFIIIIIMLVNPIIFMYYLLLAPLGALNVILCYYRSTY